MDDNGAFPSERSDPFARGLAAYRDRHSRDTCPYPQEYVEARRWNAGWDHAAFRAADADIVVDRIGDGSLETDDGR